MRQAKLRGLICHIKGQSREDLTLTISGPLSIFRRTSIYGRHLAEIVPLLAWTNRYELKATCVLRGKMSTLRLASGAPITPSGPPKLFDSKVEQNFFDECQRTLIDWDLTREPEPVQAEDTLIFPDFYLQNRKNPKQAWFIEIIGFWTPDYLSKKLKRLREAKLENVILFIDETLNCTNDELPPQARVIKYKRKIDLLALKEIVSRHGKV